MVKCPKCGIENRYGSKFCKSCGTPLDSIEKEYSIKIHPNTKNKKIIKLCVLGFFLIILYGTIIALTNHSTESDDTITDLKDMNFNVSNELKLSHKYNQYSEINNNSKLIYENKDYLGEYFFTIEKSSIIQKGIDETYGHEWGNYTRLNDTCYMRTYTTNKNIVVMYIEEHVKLDNNIYTVRSQHQMAEEELEYEETSNKTYEKIIEYLNYFNNHNNVEILKLSINKDKEHISTNTKNNDNSTEYDEYTYNTLETDNGDHGGPHIDISTEGKWTAHIDNKITNTTYKGIDDQEIYIHDDCDIIVANVQKDSDNKEPLTVEIIDNGVVISEKSTNKKYGAVTVYATL